MQKQIFEQPIETHISQNFQPKQEFHEDDVQIDIEPDETNTALEGELINDQFDRAIKPQSGFWKNVLIFTALLFGVAVVAQSVQWILDSIQQQQWIYLAFALVSFVIILFGIKEIMGEWRRLVRLKKREQLQQQSRQFLYKSADKTGDNFSAQDAEQSQQLCLAIADSLRLDRHSPAVQQWQQQINEAYTPQEITHLFSQQVLQPFDKKAKKLISQTAAESAIIVAISPLALVDMFFVAWRNLRLINRIAALYGIELGYMARIRLLRMVLVNIAFAGATEVLQDVGMDWLSQDLTAKLSARAAQGLGVGLLTARLGIKAMELCRPLVFQGNEKPTLSHVQQELLGVIKEKVLRSNSHKKARV